MDGEFFGSTIDFEYNIGDKLYEFAIMELKDFDRLKTLYTDLIKLVSTSKESNGMTAKIDFFCKGTRMFKLFLIYSLLHSSVNRYNCKNI